MQKLLFHIHICRFVKGLFHMIKYEIEYKDMRMGIAHLNDGVHENRPMAVIYAQGKNLDHMNATIDLIASAFDLLNERLAEVRQELEADDSNTDISPSANLAWYHRELEQGVADRLTLHD